MKCSVSSNISRRSTNSSAVYSAQLFTTSSQRFDDFSIPRLESTAVFFYSEPIFQIFSKFHVVVEEDNLLDRGPVCAMIEDLPLFLSTFVCILILTHRNCSTLPDKSKNSIIIFIRADKRRSNYKELT